MPAALIVHNVNVGQRSRCLCGAISIFQMAFESKQCSTDTCATPLHSHVYNAELWYWSPYRGPTETPMPSQVNLDYSSEADMVDKLRIGLALQPAATALFSNSSIRHGREGPHACWRSEVYLHLDAARCGMLSFVFSEGFGFDAYARWALEGVSCWARWALEAPLMLAHLGGAEIDCHGSGRRFRDFAAGDVPMLHGVRMMRDAHICMICMMHGTCVLSSLAAPRSPVACSAADRAIQCPRAAHHQEESWQIRLLWVS